MDLARQAFSFTLTMTLRRPDGSGARGLDAIRLALSVGHAPLPMAADCSIG
jgi:hypothetical protein